MATILFESYPKADYDNPDSALATLVKVLSGYPNDVIREVTSPETGIQRRSKFPPRTSEIVEACDALVARNTQHERFRNWGQSAPVIEGEPPETRMTKEQLVERYGGSLLPPGFGARRTDEPAGFKTGQAIEWGPLIENYKNHPERAMGLTQATGARRSHRAMDIPYPPRRMREFVR